MNEPILVIDAGTAKTAAALMTGGEGRLLREPFSGLDSWPTSVTREGEMLLVGTVAERTKNADPSLYSGRFMRVLGRSGEVTLGDRTYAVQELIAAVFDKLRVGAQRLTGGNVDRVLLTMGDDQSPDHSKPADPATPVRPDQAARQVMIAAAAAAGFTDVEFLPQPVAVTLARPGTGPAEGKGLVLVCDAGASSARISLVETRSGLGQTIAAQSVGGCGGDLLDEALAGAIRADAGSWLAPRLDAEGVHGQRAQLQFADLARLIRHQLTDSDEVEEYLGPLDPPVRFARADLERLMAPLLDQLTSGCRDMLARAKTKPNMLSDVLLVGGCARIPAFARAVSKALGRAVTPMPDPQLAAVSGGTEWAARAPTRRISALGPLPGVRALAWQLEGGAARLVEWLVPVRERFDTGESIARLRDSDDAIWDLTADQPGTMQRHCVSAGSVVASGDMLAAVKLTLNSPADLVDPPERVTDLSSGRFVAFSPDGRQAVTMDGSGTLRVWDMEAAAEIGHLKIRTPLGARGYDAAVRPDGHWLVAQTGGLLEVLDMTTGELLKRLGWTGTFETVRFGADATRVCASESNRVCIWETGGRKLLSIRERLLSGGAAASVAFSGDGNRLAVATRTELHVWDVSLRERVTARSLQSAKDRMWNMTLAHHGQRILMAIGSSVEMIDLPSGELMWTAEVTTPVRGADFTPDGMFLATVSHDEKSCSASLWAVTDGKPVHRIPLDRPCDSVRISPDGLLMAIGNDEASMVWTLVH